MNTLEQTPQGWIFSTLVDGQHWDRTLVSNENELAEHIRGSGKLRRDCGNISQGVR